MFYSFINWESQKLGSQFKLKNDVCMSVCDWITILTWIWGKWFAGLGVRVTVSIHVLITSLYEGDLFIYNHNRSLCSDQLKEVALSWLIVILLPQLDHLLENNANFNAAQLFSSRRICPTRECSLKRDIESFSIWPMNPFDWLKILVLFYWNPVIYNINKLRKSVSVSVMCLCINLSYFPSCVKAHSG